MISYVTLYIYHIFHLPSMYLSDSFDEVNDSLFDDVNM